MKYVEVDQKVSVNLMITIQLSGAQRLFDHPALRRTQISYIVLI